MLHCTLFRRLSLLSLQLPTHELDGAVLEYEVGIYGEYKAAIDAHPVQDLQTPV